MFNLRIPWVMSLLGIAAVAWPGATAAQTNLETNAGIQFNFSTPGAANLAVGGAFLALANDVTTAYTNPAGLINIADPEVHLEARSWRYTHVFTDHGRHDDYSPSGDGIDDVPGLRDGEESNGVVGLSFLSYVFPRERWAIAVYRHQLANFEADFETQGAFLRPTRSRNPLTGFPALSEGRLASLRNTMRLEIVNYSAAAAYRVTNDLSLGLGASYHDFVIDSRSERFLPPITESPAFSDQERTDVQAQVGEDSALTFSLGLFWESRNQKWAVGGVYRQSPDFTFLATSGSAAADPTYHFESSAQAARFHVPDVYGLGVAFEPTDALRISLDVDRVEYSDLTDDFVDIFNLEERFDHDPELGNFKIDDATEIHLGAQYSFYQRKTPFMLRFGAWYDPDHTLRYEGENLGLSAVYRRRGDEIHLAAGFGLSVGRVQLDAAFDYSDRVSTGSVSALIHF